MNLFDLTGRETVITGGTRGLGYGMVEGLMETEAEVVIFGNSEKVHDVATQFCDRGFRCHGIAVDLGDSQARADAFAEAVSTMGGLDTLMNCVDIQRRHRSEELPSSDWEAIMSVNLTAPSGLCQMAAREFMAKGEPGKIINVSSMLTFFGGFTVPAYAIPKGAVTQMTKAFYNEWASRSISVNYIAPGYVDTEMNTALTDPSSPRYTRITNRIPARRWGTPEGMKGTAVFPAPPAPDHLSRAVIPVDGGYLVR